MKAEYKAQIQPLSIIELSILKEAVSQVVNQHPFYLRDYGQEIRNIKHILNNPEYV